MSTHKGDPIPTAIDVYRVELRHQEGRRPTHTGPIPITSCPDQSTDCPACNPKGA